MPKQQPQYINSIIRATSILELFGVLNVQYLGIAEISAALGLSKSTVFNIVKTLLIQGWLVQDAPNGKYRLGTKVLRVSEMVVRHVSVEDLILSEMHRLRDTYNEDIVLTAMVDDMPICVEKVQSSNMLRIQSRVGRVGNLIKGSSGKALFAWQSEEFIEKNLRQLLPDTEEGEREREQIRREMQKIRENGYCTSVSEQDEGVASVTVPIRNKNGIALYSLAVIGAEKRMKEKNMDIIRHDLLETARRLEEARRFIRS